jgi:enamine deaminase RidA (YjgF/YER057c/UK114 family)
MTNIPMTNINDKLLTLGITLPEPAKPVANYVGYVLSGNLVFISGQVPLAGGKVLHPGQLGKDVSPDAGREAARQCAINLIAHLKDACGGDLGRVKRVVKLTGFVACTPEFTGHPGVINGASDLMAEVFGDAGKHARAAVGVASLPLGASVEVEAIVEIA